MAIELDQIEKNAAMKLGEHVAEGMMENWEKNDDDAAPWTWSVELGMDVYVGGDVDEIAELYLEHVNGFYDEHSEERANEKFQAFQRAIQDEARFELARLLAEDLARARAVADGEDCEPFGQEIGILRRMESHVRELAASIDEPEEREEPPYRGAVSEIVEKASAALERAEKEVEAEAAPAP